MLKHNKLLILLFCLLMFLSQRVTIGQIIETEDQFQTDVTITYLQNDGVLISDGTKKILIDAIFSQANSWINLDPDENNKVINAQAPYDNVDLILITHNHGDHYWVSNVNTHINNNPNGKVIAPPQVMTNFSGPQFLDVTPALWQSESLTVNGIELEVLHLKHFNAFGMIFDTVENFGYLIKLGGKNILHLGDAKMTVENFQSFGLADKNIDVVLIPTFYPEAHLMTSHRDALLSQVDPDHIIALHLLAGSIPNIVQQVNDLYPGATIFTTPLETFTFDATIVDYEKQTPKNFSLDQNYPNPFNPTTKIRFIIPNNEFVTMNVYNILGKEITTIVSKELEAGEYEVEFNASTIPSGIYFYELNAGNNSLKKKMVLLR